jgi:hypothetical protein
VLFATGGLIAPARDNFPAHESGVNHRRGASDSAVDCYGTGWAVELAGTAFHAGLMPNNLNPPVSSCKNPMRTYVKACTTVDAKRRAEPQRVDGALNRFVGLALTGRLGYHHITPYHFATANPTSRPIPRMKVAAIMGM